MQFVKCQYIKEGEVLSEVIHECSSVSVPAFTDRKTPKAVQLNTLYSGTLVLEEEERVTQKIHVMSEHGKAIATYCIDPAPKIQVIQ